MSPVRTATLSDLDALTTLLDGYRVFYQQQSDEAACRGFLQERLERGDSYLLVHDAGHGPDAFVQLYPVLSTVSLAPRWLLNDLFVAPTVRGRGIGRALMQAAANLAREHGVASLTLSTQIHNHAAKALYESLGWEKNEAFDTYLLSVPGSGS
ncbi:GNAT family N-acetyltransferase [Kushneria marisflavi]|uniref:GNAT family N-acetyltransferase n=1 Tax=Kushneria marisflavi TaxID=157779 RepID=A0A240UPP3_9GAMM|nr:GNAT family N-acetyltransferase [Kushneria marisflavi]ART63458.1 GNAT family N-acetyltransferase [Kushneria marisflavi]RKD84519.1 ribosomal protein S18 acetylase RimI-like enzyme [Kushneria marisflavi]